MRARSLPSSTARLGCQSSACTSRAVMADRRQARIWEFVLLFVFLFVGFDVVAEENGK